MRVRQTPSRAFLSAAAIGLSLLIPSRATPEELSGRAIVSYQLFGNGGLDAQTFLQLYDARFQHEVSDTLRFHLFFRAQGNNARYDFPLFSQKTNFWKLQPHGEIDYVLPRLQIIGTYDLYDTTSNLDGVQWQQLYQRITENLSWSPEGAPTLTVQAQQLENREPSVGIDQTENSLYQALNYSWNGLTLGEAAYLSDFQLNQPDFSRKNANLQGLFNYQNASPDGRYSVQVNGVVGWSRIEETAGPQGAEAPTPATISKAFSSHDETPADSRDVAPTSSPALIDGVFNASAGIALGPSGSSFQNIALDMGRFVALDTIRIFVRDEGGNAIQFAGLVRWDVYTSGEGLDWVPAPGETPAVHFIASLSAYEVTFRKTTSRFFKVVNFGTNTIPTFVTEVQAFFHVSLGADVARLTNLRFVSANALLSGTPTRWLNLSYYGIFNDYKVAAGGAPEYATVDNDQYVSAVLGPSSPLNLTLRYERRRAQSAGFNQEFDAAWAIAQYTYNPNLITSVEASHTKDSNFRQVATDSLRFHGYARFFPSLDLTVDLGTSRSDYRLEGTGTKVNFLNAYSSARLTEQIQLTLAANLETVRNEGALIPARTVEYGNYYGEIYYRPGPQLYVAARFGYVVGRFVSTSTRRFRVEWYPFAGGTIGIGTLYDDDVDTDGGFRRFRRLQILPQWAINPNVTLNLNYNLLNLGGSGPDGRPLPSSSSRQFFVTLTVTR
jgi:hypothetical protein